MTLFHKPLTLWESALTDPAKIIAAIDIAGGLIKSGVEIYDLVKNGEDLTEKDLQKIIDRQNAAQAAARQKIKELIS